MLGWCRWQLLCAQSASAAVAAAAVRLRLWRPGKGGYKYSQGSLCPPGLWLGAARELASGSMDD
jgi:hypothetical protein